MRNLLDIFKKLFGESFYKLVIYHDGSGYADSLTERIAEFKDFRKYQVSLENEEVVLQDDVDALKIKIRELRGLLRESQPFMPTWNASYTSGSLRRLASLNERISKVLGDE